MYQCMVWVGGCWANQGLALTNFLGRIETVIKLQPGKNGLTSLTCIP